MILLYDPDDDEEEEEDDDDDDDDLTEEEAEDLNRGFPDYNRPGEPEHVDRDNDPPDSENPWKKSP